MTTALSGPQVAKQISDQFPGSVVESDDRTVVIKSQYLLQVAGYLKTNPDCSLSYLADMTAVDYFDYFEVVYQLVSMERNCRLTLKTRLDRPKPEVASVTGVWQGAGLMEREIFDLMGISFSGHPDLRRIFLWEGFQGYPLRKDYL
jgi:NADH-quinone oxidoreductase subunit C